MTFRYEWSESIAAGGWTTLTPVDENPVASGSLEDVTVTFGAGLLAKPSLFVRVVASQD